MTLFTGLLTCKYKLSKPRLGLISRQTHQSFSQYLSCFYFTVLLLYSTVLLLFFLQYVSCIFLLFDTSTYFISILCISYDVTLANCHPSTKQIKSNSINTFSGTSPTQILLEVRQFYHLCNRHANLFTTNRVPQLVLGFVPIIPNINMSTPVSYTHLRAHET